MNSANKILGGHMKIKALGAQRQWWKSNVELGIAIGWAAVCGALWLVVRVLGIA